MSLDARLRRLEEKMGTQKTEIVILDSNNNQVPGEVLRMPTSEQDGLARLADGSERPIVYEQNWRDIMVMISYTDKPQEPDDKLRLRRADAKPVEISYVEPEKGTEEAGSAG